MTPREERLAKLLALANNNTNEAEAMSAMNMAHDYAARYGLSLDEIAAKGDSTHESHWAKSTPQYSCKGNRGQDMVDRFCTVAIGELFCCRVWKDVDDDGDTVIYFYGHNADRDAATALRWVIRAAMYHDWEMFKVGKRWHSADEVRDAKLSFHAGMGQRLVERMKAYTRADQNESKGRELIVVKNALMEQHFKKLGMQFGRGRASNYSHRAEAYAAGRNAAEHVNMGGTTMGGQARITKQ